eukprot:Skav204263  [mRNA]  locus=scaffold912:220176:222280:- [translate_table: standard]
MADGQALERRFQPVSVPEPTNEEAVQILRGIARKYEAGAVYVGRAGVVRCPRQDRYLPDKAIDLLDETGARVQLRQLATVPEDAFELRQELRDVEAAKEVAVRTQERCQGGARVVVVGTRVEAEDPRMVQGHRPRMVQGSQFVGDLFGKVSDRLLRVQDFKKAAELKVKARCWGQSQPWRGSWSSCWPNEPGFHVM